MLMLAALAIGLYSGYTAYGQLVAGMQPDLFTVLSCVLGLALAHRIWKED